jgi:hypothetical protein
MAQGYSHHGPIYRHGAPNALGSSVAGRGMQPLVFAPNAMKKSEPVEQTISELVQECRAAREE